MTGRKFGVAAFSAAMVGVAAFACSAFDADGDPSPPGTSASSTSSSSSGASSSSSSSSSGVTAEGGSTGEQSCITSVDCPSEQCRANGKKNYGNVPTGTCVAGSQCVFIPKGGKRPTVASDCAGVETCLGFRCFPVGIVPGKDGVYACGLPGDVCTDDNEQSCCHSSCALDGVCPGL